MKEAIENIQRLNEEQAKEALFQMLLKSYEEESLPIDQFEEILVTTQQRSAKIQDVTHVHVVTGESAAATLKHAFPDAQILVFPSNLSVGPLHHLENRQGWEQRKEWLRLRLEDEHYFWNYASTWETLISKMKNLPDHLPVYLWSGEHAGEYIGAQLAVTLLAGKSNPLKMVHSSEIYRKLFDSESRVTDSIHTSEMSIEQVREILNDDAIEPLDEKEREEILKRWPEISMTSKMVRVLEEGILQFHKETIFDDYILKTIQEQSESGEFIKAARIVGEVYGKVAYQVGDAFIEYRLLQLALDGVVEIEGMPRQMLLYSVRVKK
ncbi:DUF1835 domain-containing protein [Chryseomicrobium aureum]|uniref:DUF1835 domain-containing protein n=1 Tax=Chryseomicrobium aureum TaxID=1441723 RepID=UPI00370D3E8D